MAEEAWPRVDRSCFKDWISVADAMSGSIADEHRKEEIGW